MSLKNIKRANKTYKRKVRKIHDVNRRALYNDHKDWFKSNS
jgi:hypothetical protein